MMPSQAIASRSARDSAEQGSQDLAIGFKELSRRITDFGV